MEAYGPLSNVVDCEQPLRGGLDGAILGFNGVGRGREGLALDE
jgi:hypothetical protein